MLMSSSPWRSVSSAEPCPICARTSWCRRSTDGHWSICRRVNAPGCTVKGDRNGGEYYLYGEPTNGMSFPEYDPPKDPPRADDAILDNVYRFLLQRLDLDPVHREDLLRRGLNSEQIRGAGYRSLPSGGRARRAREALEVFGPDVLATVPGFYRKENERGSYWTLAGSPGLLIPVRTAHGLVVALKVRVDGEAVAGKYRYVSSTKRGGPGPGAPIHVPLHAAAGATVRITEGELKADVATALSGMLTISVPGVSNWLPALSVLRDLGVTIIHLAYDADWSANPNVGKALVAFRAALREAGFEVQVETWEGALGKGIDDVLAAGHADSIAVDPEVPGVPAEPTRAPRKGEQEEPWAPPAPFLDEREPAPFPIDILPRWAQEHVRAEAEFLQVPLDLPGALLFAATSAAVTNKLVIRVKLGWDEPVNLYLIITLPPGDKKSSAFRRAFIPIYMFERETRDGLASQIEAAVDELRIRKRTVKHWEDKLVRASADDARAKANENLESATTLLSEHRVPKAPRLTADDVTTERLAELLSENDEKMAILSSEADILDILGGRYSRDGTANFGLYLKAFTGDSVRVDRVDRNRPPISLDAPLITLCLTTQPTVIEGLARKKEFRGRGLLARIWFIYPRSLVGCRRYTDASGPDLTNYTTRMRDLLEWEPNQEQAGTYRGLVVSLSDAARACLMAFMAEIEPALAPGGDLSHVGEWGNRAVGHAVRAAGLLHVLDRAGCPESTLMEPIDEATIERGIRFVRDYLLPHAIRAHAAMGADDGEIDARAVVEYARRKHIREPNWDLVLSRRDLLADLGSRFSNVDSLDRPLRILEARGYLREVAPSGRRRTPRYEVNPFAIGVDPDQQSSNTSTSSSGGGPTAGTAGVLVGGQDENQGAGSPGTAGVAGVLVGGIGDSAGKGGTDSGPESTSPPLQQSSNTSNSPPIDSPDTLIIDLPSEDES
jgi:replicative DNA helicase